MPFSHQEFFFFFFGETSLWADWGTSRVCSLVGEEHFFILDVVFRGHIFMLFFENCLEEV